MTTEKQKRPGRKKAPPKVVKMPQKANPKEKNHFWLMMQTEEGRAQRKAWSTKKRKNPGRPKGVPDGYTRETIKPLREQAMKDAETVVDIMKKDYGVEDELAQEALRTAVIIMREPGQAREKLLAARMVLDFTKSKPVSKSEVSVGKAEEFLATLLMAEALNEEEQLDEPEVSGNTETPIH